MPTPHPDSPPRDLIEQQIYRIFRNMSMAGFDPPNPKEIAQMLTQFEAPSVMSGVKPVRQTPQQRENLQMSVLKSLVGDKIVDPNALPESEGAIAAVMRSTSPFMRPPPPIAESMNREALQPNIKKIPGRPYPVSELF